MRTFEEFIITQLYKLMQFILEILKGARYRNQINFIFFRGIWNREKIFMQRVNKFFFFFDERMDVCFDSDSETTNFLTCWRRGRVGESWRSELPLNSVRSGQKLLVSFRGRRGWHRPRRLNSILDPTVKDIESSLWHDSVFNRTARIFHLTFQRLRSKLPFGISTILFPI